MVLFLAISTLAAGITARLLLLATRWAGGPAWLGRILCLAITVAGWPLATMFVAALASAPDARGFLGILIGPSLASGVAGTALALIWDARRTPR